MCKDFYEVKPLENIKSDACVEVCVPGSKSITNRALLIAAMANGESTLKGCLSSDDSMYFIECLKTLGFKVISQKNGLDYDITISGCGGEIPNKNAEIYVGSAGTAARFLVAMLAFSDGEYTVNSSEQMKKRPMAPLIDSLRSAGAKVTCTEEEGHFPLIIKGAGKAAVPEKIAVNIDKSSQFLSALLIAASTLEKEIEIEATGSHGLSYVELTLEMMKAFGSSPKVQAKDACVSYKFSGRESFNAREYEIEPDMSAAAYFYALAAISGIRLSVKGVTSDMLQGDTQFLTVLQKMGCKFITNDKGYSEIIGAAGGKLKGGFTVDMSSFSDQALTLAAIAPFADAPITITGISHIRLQECDRINAIVQNLSALGVKVSENSDGVTIYPSTPEGNEIQTFDDHRVAMSFALTGLKVPGVRILNPDCCKKTFAQYFDVSEDVIRKIAL
ncbi:MAG: 3-phosphoshikimate 1-carboxyvinyltransferase [Ruminococcus sp.]|nr:3-phosphoshikimate 1-carboxyvinyltransferase [Ruminococcus sp.]